MTKNVLGMLVLSITLGGCLSSAPPAPPVRYFDAMPAMLKSTVPDALRGLRVQVEASPHIGQDFVVRTGEREIAFDAEHRWLVEPCELVMTVLGGNNSRAAVPDDWLSVRIERFEIDLTAAPQVHVRLALAGSRPLRTNVVDSVVRATDRTPEVLAEAMAQAVQQVANAVVAAVGN